jgi:hypothetical protein
MWLLPEAAERDDCRIRGQDEDAREGEGPGNPLDRRITIMGQNTRPHWRNRGEESVISTHPP